MDRAPFTLDSEDGYWLCQSAVTPFPTVDSAISFTAYGVPPTKRVLSAWSQGIPTTSDDFGGITASVTLRYKNSTSDIYLNRRI